MNDIEKRLRDLGDRTAEQVRYREVPRGRIVRRARLRRAVAVAAPVAAVVLFAAVAYPGLDSSGNRRDGVPVSVDLAAAAEATEQAGSARFALSMTMEFGERTITVNGEGRVDFDDFRSYFRMTEDGDFAAIGDLEMISIGRVVYQRPLGESKWVKTEVDTPAEGTPFGTNRPDEFLTYLESVSEDVTSLGEEVLDGVPVTHLRATLDPSALEETASMTSVDDEYEPIDVWIDDANRVRQMTFSATMNGADAATSTTMSMTMRFWDFGLAVNVAAPPPADVAPPSPEPRSDDPTPAPDTYVVGSRGLAEPHVVVESRGPGPAPLCVRIPGEGPEPAVVVDEVSSEELFTAAWSGAGVASGQSYSVACSEGLVAHAKVDLLLRDPTRFTLRAGEGPNEVVVELAEVRGY